jgi:hypothetical protein
MGEAHMTTGDLEQVELSGLQQEKRDRMNARWQVWSLLFALVSGFGLASVQGGDIPYLVALYPLIAMCIARFTAHSETVLDQIKAYLREVEKKHNFAGYEQFNLISGRKGVGSHQKALRDALLITEMLASVAAAYRLYDHGLLLAAILVAAIDLVASIATLLYLRKPTSGCSQAKEGADG